MRWSRRVNVWTVVLAIACIWPATAHAGKLGSVRSEVSGSSSSSSSSSSGSSSSSSSFSSCCDDDSSTTSSSRSTDVPAAPAPRKTYRRYPYEGGTGDYIVPLAPGIRSSRSHAGQLWLEGAWQGKGLYRSAGGGRIDGQFFSFDGDLSFYLEPAANDALYLGTANLSLTPLRERRAIVRLGGGMNTMIDGRVPGEGPREYALGWNLTTSFELFPAWPVVISGRLDLGKLHAAWMGRARGSVGVMLWRMELFGGYEHTQVGSVGLGGPMAGLRLWL